MAPETRALGTYGNKKGRKETRERRKERSCAVRITRSCAEWSSTFGLDAKPTLSRSSRSQTSPLSLQDSSSYSYSPTKLAPLHCITALGF